MARNRKKSATAEEHNAEQEEARQEAREADSNVVDMLTPAERWKKRQGIIMALADRIDSNLDAIATLRDAAKSIRLDAKSENVDWKALTQMVALRRKAESKRLASEKSRREVARAFGWDDGLQVDMFDDDKAQGLTPGQQREWAGRTDDPTDPALTAAADAGFLTEEERAENAKFAESADAAKKLKDIWGDSAEVEEFSAEDA